MVSARHSEGPIVQKARNLRIRVRLVFRSVFAEMTFGPLDYQVGTNIKWVPWEVLNTKSKGLSFQHLPHHQVTIYALKNMFDPCIGKYSSQ